MQAAILAAFVIASTPASPPASPARVPAAPEAPALLLLAHALDESHGDSCAALAVLREAEKEIRDDPEVTRRVSEQERRCERLFEGKIAEADMLAKEGDFASAHAIGRYVLAEGPPSVRKTLRLRRVAWHPAKITERPLAYDEKVAEARAALAHEPVRLYEACEALRTATLLWPHAAEARTLLAETEVKAHERSRGLLAEARRALAGAKPDEARAAVNEALALEAPKGSPHRAEALGLALQVADALATRAR